MTDLANISNEELQRQIAQNTAEAAKAQEEVQQRALKQQQEQEARDHASDLRVIDAHQDLDTQLRTEGEQFYRSIDEAVAARDLSAAFNAWINYQATFAARQVIRNTAENAEIRTPTGKTILPTLRYRAETFIERLETAMQTIPTRLGGNIAADLLEPLEQ